MTVAITRLDLSAMALRERAARATDAKVSTRLLAIALVLEGGSRLDAAEACAMDRQTLRDRHRKPPPGEAQRIIPARAAPTHIRVNGTPGWYKPSGLEQLRRNPVVSQFEFLVSAAARRALVM